MHIPAVTWLVDPTAFYALIILMLWGMGGGMVISLAGLQGIPSELSEAAVVDGANRWQAFRSVTLPMLSPVLFFQAVTGTITALQILVQPLLLAQTNSITSVTQIPHSNLLYVVYVYQQFTNMQHLGYGAALLWVFFVVILLITLLVLRSGRFWVYYEVGCSLPFIQHSRASGAAKGDENNAWSRLLETTGIRVWLWSR